MDPEYLYRLAKAYLEQIAPGHLSVESADQPNPSLPPLRTATGGSMDTVGMRLQQPVEQYAQPDNEIETMRAAMRAAARDAMLTR